MAGRGRGRAALAPFPEGRSQLRRPKEELLALNGSVTQTAVCEEKPKPESPKSEKDSVDSDELKKLCFRLKYLASSSDGDFKDTIEALKVAVKTKNDASSAADHMHTLSQLGPDQAKITALAFVDLANLEIEGNKFRSLFLGKMQADFEGFKGKSQEEPNVMLSNAVLLCEVYCRYLINGAPLKPLQSAAWEYLNFMLQSRQPFYMKQCMQIAQVHGAFLSKHGESEMALFLNELRGLILDETVEKHVRKQALKTLEISLNGWKPSTSKFYGDA